MTRTTHLTVVFMCFLFNFKFQWPHSANQHTITVWHDTAHILVYTVEGGNRWDSTCFRLLCDGSRYVWIVCSFNVNWPTGFSHDDVKHFHRSVGFCMEQIKCFLFCLIVASPTPLQWIESVCYLWFEIYQLSYDIS